MKNDGVSRRLGVAFNDAVFGRVVEERKLRVGETKTLRRAIRAGCISQLRDPRDVWAPYAHYCERTLVPEIVIAAPLFEESDATGEVDVILNIFPGTHVGREGARKIRHAFAGFPVRNVRPDRRRFLMRGDGTLRPVAVSRGSGRMTWDGVTSRWLAHPAMPIGQVDPFIHKLQRLLSDAYDFAVVHAVTDF